LGSSIHIPAAYWCPPLLQSLMSEETNIIILDKLIASRLKKEKELKYYQEELMELQEKMKMLQMDIDVTNIIIRMINDENVVDLKTYLIGKGE
jgi:hypothetical protein